MIIALSVVITLLSVATVFSWYILFQVFKTNVGVLSMLDHLSQMLPQVADSVNRSIDLMDRKESRISLND